MPVYLQERRISARPAFFKESAGACCQPQSKECIAGAWRSASDRLAVSLSQQRCLTNLLRLTTCFERLQRQLRNQRGRQGALQVDWVGLAGCGRGAVSTQAAAAAFARLECCPSKGAEVS